MGRSFLELTFAALLAWACVACANGGSDCGGPISDFPTCATDDGSEVSSDAGGRDQDGGAGAGPQVPGSDGAPMDGGFASDGDGGPDAGIDGGADGGCADQPECTGELTVLDLTGSAPEGPVHITGFALRYTQGLVYATNLSFYGSVANQPVRLDANIAVDMVPGPGPATPAAPPGIYGNADAGYGLSTSLVRCASGAGELAVSVEIFEHSEVAVAAGGSGKLKGELRVEQAGWTLNLPFETTRACAVLSGP